MTDETVARAPRARLSPARIFAAALAVIDEEGLPALNMRRLGAELGVDAMAVYRHVPNKQAILDGVVDLVMVDLAEGGDDEVCERAYRFFTSLRAVLAAHPNVIPLVASSGLQTGAAADKAARLLAAIGASGLSSEQAVDAFRTLESFTLGYAWLEVSGFVGELPESAPFVRSSVRRGAISLAGDGRDDRYDRCLRAVLAAWLSG
jgi:AcrR family transcriptional regulator